MAIKGAIKQLIKLQNMNIIPFALYLIIGTLLITLAKTIWQEITNK
jgi:hypothetical protein